LPLAVVQPLGTFTNGFEATVNGSPGSSSVTLVRVCVPPLFTVYAMVRLVEPASSAVGFGVTVCVTTRPTAEPTGSDEMLSPLRTAVACPWNWKVEPTAPVIWYVQ
jgi:hypothetical protein